MHISTGAEIPRDDRRVFPPESLEFEWRAAAEMLASSGVEEGLLDARLLIAAACRIRSLDIFLSPHRMLNEDELDGCKKMITRRAGGEPVSRILGRRAFWQHDFSVTRATLDPRADSEALVEVVLKIVDHEGWRDRPLKILDLGTGTGCLLLSVLSELPFACGTGTDISDEVLAVARANARTLRLCDRAWFQMSDWTADVVGTFDIVISNPPYICSGDIAGLAREVKAHDPEIALDGGVDGLDAYRGLLAGVGNVQKSGWIVLEVGRDRHNDVACLLSGAGYDLTLPDLAFNQDLGLAIRCVAGSL